MTGRTGRRLSGGAPSASGDGQRGVPVPASRSQATSTPALDDPPSAAVTSSRRGYSRRHIAWCSCWMGSSSGIRLPPEAMLGR